MFNNFSFTNYNASEFVWDGPTISCIGLCEGDLVSDVIYDLGKKLCDILKEFSDLSTLDLTCVIDECDKDQYMLDYSLGNLLRIMDKNDLSIKNLIDNLVTSINESRKLNLNLDLACLKNCPDYSQSKFEFICNKGGNVGDTISIKYKTLYNPTPVIMELKKGECRQFNLPQEKVTIIEVTPIIGSVVSYTQTQSIGFNLCKDCGDCPDCIPCPDCNLLPIIDNSLSGCYKNKDFTITQILQFFIYRICCQDAVLTKIEEHTTSIEKQYTDIVESYSTYKEPFVTSCMNNSPILHTMLTSRLSPYLCDIRNNLGSTAQVLNSIVSGCNARWISTDFPQTLCSPMGLFDRSVTYALIDGITYPINVNVAFGQLNLVVAALNSNLPTSLARFSVDPLGSGQLCYNNIAASVIVFMLDCDGVTPISINFNSNFIQADNLVQDSQNQWSVLCDTLNRLKTRENSTCCLPNCDAIKLGYRFVYDGDTNSYQMIFNKVYGTVIPDGWVDTGSVIQVTDIHGIVYLSDMEISNDYTFDIDMSGLDISKVASVGIKTEFTHSSGIVCKKCISDYLPAIDNLCSFCRICANGTVESDLIRVYYKTADNPVSRSQTLSSGACITFKLPGETPTILSSIVLTPGSDIIIGPDPLSDCAEGLDIPNSTKDTCWFFKMPVPTNYSKVVMDHFLNGGFLSSTSQIDFDTKISSDLIEDFYEYKDSNNTGGISLSGKIAASTQLYTDNLSSSIPDKIELRHLTPTFPSGTPVIENTICTDVFQTTIQISKTGTGAGVGLNILGNSSVMSIGNAGILGGDLVFNQSFTPLNGTDSGFILRVQGLNPDGPVPEIGIKNPLNNVITYVKGELIGEDTVCTCPV